jgi:macrolide transport system ATP-binding/permease protein
MLNDLRYALRTLRANRLFAAMAILSLALGIGANTAIYSFMDAILVRTLPIQNPAALVALQWHAKTAPALARSINGSMWDHPELGRVSPNLPWRAFEVLSKDNPVLSHVVAFRNTYRFTALIQGQGTPVEGLYCTGGFFNALGTPPAAGRLIAPDDDREGVSPVAVISYAFAQRRFGGAEQALGQTALVNDTPFTIVGVTHPGFPGIVPGQRHDIYMPMMSGILVDRIYSGNPRERFTDEKYYWAEILGRLKPGVTLPQAQAALGPMFHQWVSSVASSDEERKVLPQLAVLDASRGLDQMRRQYSKPLFFLMTLVGLILTIACANLANLLLARAAGRRREMAVRLSLGAGRARIVRQLLTESLLLASLGGVIGLLFAYWGIRGLSVLMANGRESFLLDVTLNWRVLAVTMGLALLTGVLFGLAPALQSTRVDLTTALKQTRAGESRKRFGWLKVSLSQTLVVTQIAVSLLLLVAAGLFVRTLNKLNSIEVGFNRENLLLFSVHARQAGYRQEAMPRFFANLQERFASIPGVRSASASNFGMVTQSMNSGRIQVPGFTGPDATAAFLSVAPKFFETMQIPILLGRAIDERDIAAGTKVAVVNEVFVKKYLGGQSPVGMRFRQGRAANATEYEIVGVARNARYHSLKNEIPAVAYNPYTHQLQSLGSLTFELRAAGDPLSLVAAVREVVRQADSRIPVTDIRTQDAAIDQTIGQERTFATLCTAFALLAVAIACVGLYGTMAYSVARRTNELGLRMALGAQRKKLIWMVLREVFVMAAVGLAIGVPVALATTRFVKSFLFEMKPNDPWAIAGAAVVLVLAAVAAGYGPAWRASRIDPWNALRHE